MTQDSILITLEALSNNFKTTVDNQFSNSNFNVLIKNIDFKAVENNSRSSQEVNKTDTSEEGDSNIITLKCSVNDQGQIECKTH